MRRTFFQHWIAWVCLLTFGLQSGLGAAGVVRCTHLDGASHIGFACERDADGCCRDDCGLQEESQDDDSANALPGHSERPCQDRPLHSEFKSTVRSGVSETVKACFTTPVPVPMLPGSDSLPPRSAGVVARSCNSAPIMASVSLRTIIMLV